MSFTKNIFSFAERQLSEDSSSSISTSAMEMIIDRLRRERIRDSTRRNYYSIWKTFNQFFIRLDVKPRTWEDRLILFVAYLIQGKKQSQTIKSYISAVKVVLRDDGVTINEDKFLFNSLTRACKLKHDRVRTRLPINKGMLHVLLRRTRDHFNREGQRYLKHMYCALFATAYFGMFRVGELMSGGHPIRAVDVHIGKNKKKMLFILRSSKTHGECDKPQVVKIQNVSALKEHRKKIEHTTMYNDQLPISVTSQLYLS